MVKRGRMGGLKHDQLTARGSRGRAHDKSSYPGFESLEGCPTAERRPGRPSVCLSEAPPSCRYAGFVAPRHRSARRYLDRGSGILPKDLWFFPTVGLSSVLSLGSTAAEGLPRIGRTSIARLWHSL